MENAENLPLEPSEQFAPSEPQTPSEPPLVPEPMPEKPAWRSAWAAAGFVAVVGGAFLLLASSGSTRTMGATRSRQLEWQQRQAEIEQAVQEAEP